MPYKSDAQRRYFNANRAKLEAQGVDVDEWNDSSRGKKLPERAKKKKTEKSAVALLAKLAAESQPLEPPSLRQAAIAGLGGLGTQLGIIHGNNLYYDSQFGLDAKAPKRYSPERRDAYNKLKALYGKNAPLVAATGTRREPAAYYPQSHVVGLSPQLEDEAGHLLAHELGHARQRTFLKSPTYRALRQGGILASLYGSIAPFLRRDPDAARTDALIGTAGMLPTLGIEFDASLRGSNLMKRLAQQEGTWDKMKLLEKLKYRLGAFRGFPTYLATASLPLASYGTRLGLGGYGTKSKPQPKVDSFGEKIKQLVDRVRGQLK